jgi:hypothetical protein
MLSAIKFINNNFFEVYYKESLNSRQKGSQLFPFGKSCSPLRRIGVVACPGPTCFKNPVAERQKKGIGSSYFI